MPPSLKPELIRAHAVRFVECPVLCNSKRLLIDMPVGEYKGAGLPACNKGAEEKPQWRGPGDGLGMARPPAEVIRPFHDSILVNSYIV